MICIIQLSSIIHLSSIMHQTDRQTDNQSNSKNRTIPLVARFDRQCRHSSSTKWSRGPQG